jgi:hypothetical protein
MDREELHSELHRLDCGHKWCGLHGYLFHPEKTGGVKIVGTRLQVWGCCVNIQMDLPEAAEVLRALPDGAGHKKLCDAFRVRAGMPESPHCLYCNGHIEFERLNASCA